MLKDAIAYMIENTVPVAVGVAIMALWLLGLAGYLRRRFSSGEGSLTERGMRAAVSMGRRALGFGFAKSEAA